MHRWKTSTLNLTAFWFWLSETPVFLTWNSGLFFLEWWSIFCGHVGLFACNNHGFDYKVKAAVSFSKNRISEGVIVAPFFGK
jgi:hypothetical protein